MKIDEALKAVARDDEHGGASPAVEARLLAEVRQLAPAPARRWWPKIAALAAAAVIVAALIPWAHTSTPAPESEVTTAFMPLFFNGLPLTGGRIVRLRVPEQALATYGLAVPDAVDASRTVLADVLVGDDGLARAVRFVRSPVHQE